MNRATNGKEENRATRKRGVSGNTGCCNGDHIYHYRSDRQEEHRAGSNRELMRVSMQRLKQAEKNSRYEGDEYSGHTSIVRRVCGNVNLFRKICMQLRLDA